jgi:hypothetical protein
MSMDHQVFKSKAPEKTAGALAPSRDSVAQMNGNFGRKIKRSLELGTVETEDHSYEPCVVQKALTAVAIACLPIRTP